MSFCCVVFRFRPQHGYAVGKYRFGTIGEWGKLFCAYKLSKLSGAKWYSSHCWCEMCVCVLRGCLSVMRGITFGEGNAGHIKCESMNTNNTNWGLMRTQTCLSPASTAPKKKKNRNWQPLSIKMYWLEFARGVDREPTRRWVFLRVSSPFTQRYSVYIWQCHKVLISYKYK